MLHAFKAAAEVGNYEDAAVLPETVDPQLHLSRNDIPQPFFLICEKDTILGQMSGTTRMSFRGSSVNYFDMEPGDMVYVPAGTPHRITPNTPSVHIRYKVRDTQREAALWVCPRCDEEISRIDWRVTDPPSLAYAAASRWFNEEVAGRPCPRCAEDIARVDSPQLEWSAVQ